MGLCLRHIMHVAEAFLQQKYIFVAFNQLPDPFFPKVQIFHVLVCHVSQRLSHRGSGHLEVYFYKAWKAWRVPGALRTYISGICPQQETSVNWLIRHPNGLDSCGDALTTNLNLCSQSDPPIGYLNTDFQTKQTLKLFSQRGGKWESVEGDGGFPIL